MCFASQNILKEISNSNFMIFSVNASFRIIKIMTPFRREQVSSRIARNPIAAENVDWGQHFRQKKKKRCKFCFTEADKRRTKPKSLEEDFPSRYCLLRGVFFFLECIWGRDNLLGKENCSCKREKSKNTWMFSNGDCSPISVRPRIKAFWRRIFQRNGGANGAKMKRITVPNRVEEYFFTQ